MITGKRIRDEEFVPDWEEILKSAEINRVDFNKLTGGEVHEWMNKMFFIITNQEVEHEPDFLKSKSELYSFMDPPSYMMPAERYFITTDKEGKQQINYWDDGKFK